MAEKNFTPQEARLVRLYKNKHPQYDLPDIDNRRLLGLIYEKMPQYRNINGESLKSENFLQKAIKESTASALAGGLPLASFVTGANIPRVMTGQEPGISNIEQGLPSGLQMAGSTLGTLIGTPTGNPYQMGIAGGTLGRTIGEMGKQGVEGLVRGKNISGGESLSKIGGAATSAAVTESLGALGGKILDKTILSGPMTEFGKKMSGSAIGGIKNVMRKSGFNPDEILKPVSDAISNLKGKFTRTPDLLPKLTKIEDDFIEASMKGGQSSLDELYNMRGRLDDLAKESGVYQAQAMKAAGKTKSPFLKGKTKEFSEVGEILQARDKVNDIILKTADKYGLKKQLEGANKGFGKYAGYQGINVPILNIPQQVFNAMPPAIRNLIYGSSKVGGKVLASGASEAYEQMYQ